MEDMPYSKLYSKKILIYSDGSSRGNPGRGGWAFVLVHDNQVIEGGGREAHTTNNRMEMKACIEALKEAKKQNQKVGKASMTDIEFFTDSKYLINGIRSWIHSWQRNNWKTKTGSDVLNTDLWQEILELVGEFKVKWHYVKGHAGFKTNERVDHIATSSADETPVVFYRGPLAGYKYFSYSQLQSERIPVGVTGLADHTSRTSRTSRAPAFSYVAKVAGSVQVFKDWPSCEKFVKGKSAAKYKKVFSKIEESELISEWSS